MKFAISKSLRYDSIALFAGMSLTLAFAPFSLFPLACIAVALLLIVLLDAGPKRAFWRGFLFGIGLFGTGVSWVFISIHEFGHASIFLSGIITALFIVILALFPGLTGYFLNRLFPYNGSQKLLLAFPALWVLSEWLRSWLGTGFPWLSLGDSQLNSPLRGFAPILSVYGVSLAVVLGSGLLVNAWRCWQLNQKKIMAFNLLALVGLFFLGGGLSLISWTTSYGTPVTVTLVQGNIPQETKWTYAEIKPALQQYQDLTAPFWDKSKLIVWPESAIPIPLQYSKSLVNHLDMLAKKNGTALITGIPVRHGYQDSYYNAVIAVGEHTNDYYLKRRLVPFGEYTPFPKLFNGFMQKFNIPMSNLESGPQELRPMEVNGIKIAAFICYEIAFAEQVLFREGNIDLLLTINDDAWFGKSIALAQHLGMAQMRALEVGRPLLFVSNTGLTAIISAKGKINAIAPPYEPYVLTGHIQKVKGTTPLQRHALDPLFLLVILFIFKSVLEQKKHHKEAKQNSYG